MIYYLCDTETTGVSSDDKVCEVALMQIDENFNVISQHCSLVNRETNPLRCVSGKTASLTRWWPMPHARPVHVGHRQPLLAPDVVFVAHNASFGLSLHEGLPAG